MVEKQVIILFIKITVIYHFFHQHNSCFVFLFLCSVFLWSAISTSKPDVDPNIGYYNKDRDV